MMAIFPRSNARWHWGVGSVLALIGFLFVLQFRANRPLRQEAELPSIRARDLAVLIEQQEEARRGLQGEIDALRRTLADYDTATTQGHGLAETMRRDAATYRIVLGLTSVEGPGVIVRLTEEVRAGAIVAPLVQAQDLSVLVNELWAAGAEAIAINGIRLLATTGFRQDERSILVGAVAIRPPYQLEAIGNSTVIRAALHIRGGFVDGARAIGIHVEVSEHEHLRLPALPAPASFRYAVPLSR